MTGKPFLMSPEVHRERAAEFPENRDAQRHTSRHAPRDAGDGDRKADELAAGRAAA